MSTQTDAPLVQIASAQYKGDGVVELLLETEDRMKISFQLGALAMLLTLGPAGKLALHDLENKRPLPEQPAAPDTPEGLEG